MTIATIVHNQVQKENLIILNFKESQVFIEVFESYCKANKRKQKAKTLLKKMSKDLDCY